MKKTAFMFAFALAATLATAKEPRKAPAVLAEPPPLTNEYYSVSVVDGGVTNTFRCRVETRMADFRELVKAHGKRVSIERDGRFVRWKFADGYVYERKYPKSIVDSFSRFRVSEKERAEAGIPSDAEKEAR